MNLTQSLLVLVPVALVYGYFVCAAKSKDRVNVGVNLVVGVVFVPLILAFLPMILLSLHANGWRKRRWVEVLVPAIILVALGGYGALVWHLRDRPALPPAAVPVGGDLPVERSN